MEQNLNDMSNHIRNMITLKATSLIGTDLRKIILFGSYARGDFTDDSDIDIAVLTESGENYLEKMSDISLDVMESDNAVVNFICIPFSEFQKKKSWYPFYKNIDKEGIVWYG